MSKLPTRQIHLDFHTSEKIDGVGSKFDKKNFQDNLKKAHVNSITVFAKCHHGMSYFPTKYGEMHPGLHGFNLLQAELDACREIDVCAPVYISAGFDQRYIHEHPEDRFIRQPEDTYKKYVPEAHYDLICMNSPYLELLANQVKEVVEVFNPVGIFLDIVAPRLCYCRHCRRIIEQRGLDQSDKQNFVALSHETYRKYCETINEAARSVNKDVRIFHNGGNVSCRYPDYPFYNTHLELESLPTGGWGYDHFPKSARYAATIGLEYLGMTGKFHTSWGEFGGFKHPNALKYEVALSMSFGAKCSVGDQMHPYGFLDDATYSLIGKAYEYGEKIEEYCLDGRFVSDIGVLLAESSADSYVDGSVGYTDRGICRALNEGKYLYTFVDRNSDFDDYKLLILANDVRVDAELESKLKEYTSKGKKLLCMGTSGLKKATDEFAFDLGAEFVGKSEFNPTYMRPEFSPFGIPSSSFVIYTELYNVKKTDTCEKVLANARNPFFNRTPEHFCSHKHAPFEDKDCSAGITFGKDGAYIAWDLGSEYAEVGCMIAKAAFLKTVEELMGDKKTLITNMPSAGYLTLQKQDEKSRYVANLVYGVPMKRGKAVEIIEELMPVYDTVLKVRISEKVKRIYLGAQGRELDFTQKDGIVDVTLDKFECHESVVFDV